MPSSTMDASSLSMTNYHSVSGPHPHTASGGSQPLRPTWHGFIGSTWDALKLFEACLLGRLPHVPRRPHDRERNQLITSGSVFIYEEASSGIKRWTDGVQWSPSRILGNFLIYRELEKPFAAGEKKRAMKRDKPNPNGVTKPSGNSNNSHNNHNGPARNTGLLGYSGLAHLVDPNSGYEIDPNHLRELERSLLGSLVDSYQFKQDGLIKKTISVEFRSVTHHIVSYYRPDDVVNGILTSPDHDPMLASIVPRPELVSAQTLRSPIDDPELMVHEPPQANVVRPGMASYGVQPHMPMLPGPNSRSMSMPTLSAYHASTAGVNSFHHQNAAQWSPANHYTHTIPHGLPPTPNSFSQPVASPAYATYGSPNQPRMPRMPSYSQTMPQPMALQRRHSQNAFDRIPDDNPAAAAAANTYQVVGSVPMAGRPMDGSHLLPTTGAMPSHGHHNMSPGMSPGMSPMSPDMSHGSYSSPSIYEQPNSGMTATQHTGVTAGYDSSSAHQAAVNHFTNSSQVSSAFETNVAGHLSNQYNGVQATQHNANGFESPDDEQDHADFGFGDQHGSAVSNLHAWSEADYARQNYD